MIGRVTGATRVGYPLGDAGRWKSTSFFVFRSEALGGRAKGQSSECARNFRTPRISLSLRAQRSNLHPVAHCDGDCRVAMLLTRFAFGVLCTVMAGLVPAIGRG